jgi:hypothetical protein
MTRSQFIKGMTKIKCNKEWEEAGPYTCNDLFVHLGWKTEQAYRNLFCKHPPSDAYYDVGRIPVGFGFSEYTQQEIIKSVRVTALTIFEQEVLATKAYKGF